VECPERLQKLFNLPLGRALAELLLQNQQLMNLMTPGGLNILSSANSQPIRGAEVLQMLKKKEPSTRLQKNSRLFFMEADQPWFYKRYEEKPQKVAFELDELSST